MVIVGRFYDVALESSPVTEIKKSQRLREYFTFSFLGSVSVWIRWDFIWIEEFGIVWKLFFQLYRLIEVVARHCTKGKVPCCPSSRSRDDAFDFNFVIKDLTATVCWLGYTADCQSRLCPNMKMVILASLLVAGTIGIVRSGGARLWKPLRLFRHLSCPSAYVQHAWQWSDQRVDYYHLFAAPMQHKNRGPFLRLILSISE